MRGRTVCMAGGCMCGRSVHGRGCVQERRPLEYTLVCISLLVVSGTQYNYSGCESTLYVLKANFFQFPKKAAGIGNVF